MLIQQMLNVLRDPDLNFGARTNETLLYFAIPMLLAIVISLPLGVIGSRSAAIGFVATNVTGLARAIPTLAFLAGAEPLLGLGFGPTVVALTLLGIPPILLNTVAGLRGVDAPTIDAARGMGMTSLQIFQRVQAPLALPVVAAGIRTAAVQIIATIPIAAFFFAGTWGVYIELGLSDSPSDRPALFVGVILISLFALIAEVVLARVQRALTPAGLRVREETARAVQIDTPTREPVPA